MSDPMGKQARVIRSRAACSGCRATKQKCDGPSQIPCRRCQLYNIPCEYPPASTSSTGSVKTVNSASRPTAAPLPLPPPFAMDDRLREISDRLKAIETSLARVNLASGDAGAGMSDRNSPQSFAPHRANGDLSQTGSSHAHADDPAQIIDSVGTANAVQTISDTIDLLEALEREKSPPTSQQSESTGFSPPFGGLSNTTYESVLPPAATGPDVVLRGILTVDECAASIKIFFRLVAPWLLLLEPQHDGDPMVLRERSPLLFHTILLTTSYYLMDVPERGAAIYHSLMGIVNELVAPIIISTQAHHLKPDTVKALLILLLYKPIQLDALRASGVTSLEEAEQRSKLSSTSSSTLWGVIVRTAHTISLHLAPNAFTKLYSPTIAPPPEVLSNLRLWMWVCIADTHGALTTARVGNIDLGDALKVTRMLASLSPQRGDVRISAHVELYGIVKTAATSGWYNALAGKRCPPHELRKFNRAVDEWEEYWTPELERAADKGDGLATTILSTWMNFVKLIINATIYNRWRNERKAMISRGEGNRPAVKADDWPLLQTVVDSLEQLVFPLCEESRVHGSPLRKVQWPARVNDEPRRKLTLDKTVVDMYRTSYDPLTCVAFVFSIILVARMANDGLTTCEFVCTPELYEDPTRPCPRLLVGGAKLAVLLDLVADFLSAMAPTRTHPARKHARMLRTILAAGTLGQNPNPGRPQSEHAQQPPLPLDQMFPSSQGSTRDDQSDQTPSASSSGQTGSPPALPSLPSLTPANAPSRIPLSFADPMLANNAGETLASILGGISPTYFGDPSLFNGMDLGGSLDDQNMVIDWDSLEKNMQAQQGHAQSGADAFTAASASFGQELLGYFPQR